MGSGGTVVMVLTSVGFAMTDGGAVERERERERECVCVCEIEERGRERERERERESNGV